MSQANKFDVDIKKSMRILISQLRAASMAYAEDGESFMTDQEYDRSFRVLKTLEEEYQVAYTDSPTQKLKMNAASALPTVMYYPGWYSRKEFETVTEMDQTAALKQHQIVLSWMMDGVPLIAKYDKGELFQIILADDGFSMGKEVTHLMGLFRNLPLRIPVKTEVEVRGIGLFSWDEYKTINIKNGDLYNTPKEMAEDTLLTLDPKMVADRSMLFMAYEEHSKLSVRYDRFVKAMLLAEWGFDFSEFTQFLWSTGNKQRLTSHGAEKDFLVCDSSGIPISITRSDTISNALTLFDSKNCPYPVSGVAIDILNIEESKRLGVSGDVYNGLYLVRLDQLDEFAHRGNSQIQQSGSYRASLQGLEQHITSTGMYAVELQVNYNPWKPNKIMIHDPEVLDSLKLGTKDILELQKIGQGPVTVIQNTTPSNRSFQPVNCPYCGKRLVKKNIGQIRALFCETPVCRKISFGIHFCSSYAANIKVSPSILKSLYLNGIIASPVDLYTKVKDHREEILQAVSGIDEQQYQELVDEIEKSRDMSMGRFLVCLGIPLMSPFNAKKLETAFHGSIQDFAAAVEKHDSFVKRGGVSETLSKNIHDWFDDIEHIIYFGALRPVIHVNPSQTTSAQTLSGKTIVITGTLKNYTRAEAERLIRQNGGIAVNTVTRKTDFLVVASSPGETKINRAKQLGTRILTEQQFLSMIV